MRKGSWWHLDDDDNDRVTQSINQSINQSVPLSTLDSLRTRSFAEGWNGISSKWNSFAPMMMITQATVCSWPYLVALFCSMVNVQPNKQKEWQSIDNCDMDLKQIKSNQNEWQWQWCHPPELPRWDRLIICRRWSTIPWTNEQFYYDTMQAGALVWNTSSLGAKYLSNSNRIQNKTKSICSRLTNLFSHPFARWTIIYIIMIMYGISLLLLLL